ncbi:MAG TPA: DUF4124 domain-containing protein [Burkholderiales bacterium]|nr:DUF4124 domain-containing protein [Burkholderiales bacterium]
MKAFLASLVLALLPLAALAAPVKCVDAKGKVTYMDETGPGADKCQPITGSTVVVPAGPSSAPASAPPDNSLEQKRQHIAEAEARLAEAKQRLAEQEATREGNERNYARVLERLKPYQDAVDAAEKDLERARSER